jgi:deoxyribose-phosphate aldolase
VGTGTETAAGTGDRTEAGARPGAVAPASALERARGVIGTATLDDAALRRWLHGLPGVDQVGADGRAAMLATRSIKTTSKAWALELAIRMIDLTTLEGADTPGAVRSLCAKARRPDPDDPGCPPVAAVCVYNDLVPVAVEALRGSGIKVAAVATAFPSGRASLGVKLADTRDAVAGGADEVDMVIDRGAFLSGRYGAVFEQITAVREVCAARPGPPAHLKVILETGELVTYDNVRRAAWLAMAAGADFVKTSTGKTPIGATPAAAAVMLRTIAARPESAARVGFKAAGGVRTVADAMVYLNAVEAALGPAALVPARFRIGASSLLNDIEAVLGGRAAGAVAAPGSY